MIAAEPKRVLIIRLSAIGDVVFASPLVAACKKRYPEAEIDWLAAVSYTHLTLPTNREV